MLVLGMHTYTSGVCHCWCHLNIIKSVGWSCLGAREDSVVGANDESVQLRTPAALLSRWAGLVVQHTCSYSGFKHKATNGRSVTHHGNESCHMYGCLLLSTIALCSTLSVCRFFSSRSDRLASNHHAAAKTATSKERWKPCANVTLLANHCMKFWHFLPQACLTKSCEQLHTPIALLQFRDKKVLCCGNTENNLQTVEICC